MIRIPLAMQNRYLQFFVGKINFVSSDIAIHIWIMVVTIKHLLPETFVFVPIREVGISCVTIDGSIILLHQAVVRLQKTLHLCTDSPVGWKILVKAKKLDHLLRLRFILSGVGVLLFLTLLRLLSLVISSSLLLLGRGFGFGVGREFGSGEIAGSLWGHHLRSREIKSKYVTGIFVGMNIRLKSGKERWIAKKKYGIYAKGDMYEEVKNICDLGSGMMMMKE